MSEFDQKMQKAIDQMAADTGFQETIRAFQEAETPISPGQYVAAAQLLAQSRHRWKGIKVNMEGWLTWTAVPSQPPDSFLGRADWNKAIEAVESGLQEQYEMLVALSLSVQDWL